MKIAFWKLGLAYFIDWILVSLISAVIGFPVGVIMGTIGASLFADPGVLMTLISFCSLIISAVVFVCYFTLMEYFLHASVGKLAMKIVITPKP